MNGQYRADHDSTAEIEKLFPLVLVVHFAVPGSAGIVMTDYSCSGRLADRER